MKSFILSLIIIATAAICCGCDHLDNKRIPPMPVYVPFATEGDWNAMRLGGAPDFKYFIKDQKIPSDYHYSALSATGFGGVLLIYDVNNVPLAYDLACPVECKRDVRVTINKQTMEAVCEKCHSTFDVFTLHGHPLSGPAAESGFGMTMYSVGPGRNGEYIAVY